LENIGQVYHEVSDPGAALSFTGFVLEASKRDVFEREVGGVVVIDKRLKN